MVEGVPPSTPRMRTDAAAPAPTPTLERVVDPEEVGLSSERLRAVDGWMSRWIADGVLPCALVAIMRDGGLAYLGWEGWSSLEASRPLEPDAIFRIFSMTKPLTSVAALMLSEEGAFDLDDHVAAFLPAFADLEVITGGTADAPKTEPARAPMTVRHLLTHTSGLTYGEGGAGPVAELYLRARTDFWPDDGPLAEVVDRLARLPLRWHPGDRWEYGVSTDVLGRLVEIWSGQPFDRFVAERIAGPLGMTDTSFEVPASSLDRFPALYDSRAAGRLELREAAGEGRQAGGVTTMSGGGGLVATARDYLRFAEMLRRGGELDGVRLLRPDTVAAMTTDRLPEVLGDRPPDAFLSHTEPGSGFGLGVSVAIDPHASPRAAAPGEFGWGGYASTLFSIAPSLDLTILLMTQVVTADPTPFQHELWDLVHAAVVDR